MYIDDPRLEAHLVSDVYLPEAAANPPKMVFVWLAVIGGVVFMFWALGNLAPN